MDISLRPHRYALKSVCRLRQVDRHCCHCSFCQPPYNRATLRDGEVDVTNHELIVCPNEVLTLSYIHQRSCPRPWSGADLRRPRLVAAIRLLHENKPAKSSQAEQVDTWTVMRFTPRNPLILKRPNSAGRLCWHSKDLAFRSTVWRKQESSGKNSLPCRAVVLPVFLFRIF